MGLKSKQARRKYNRKYYLANREKLLPSSRKRARLQYLKVDKNIRNKREREKRIEEKRELGHTYNSSAQSRYRNRLKLKAINAMGGKCVCCGEDEPDFLCIDHVNNDGNQERKSGKIKPGGGAMWLYLIKNNFPNGYQLMCMNCNWSKRLNNGVCVHQL